MALVYKRQSGSCRYWKSGLWLRVHDADTTVVSAVQHDSMGLRALDGCLYLDGQ
jgi:hypothetical protein